MLPFSGLAMVSNVKMILDEWWWCLWWLWSVKHKVLRIRIINDDGEEPSKALHLFHHKEKHHPLYNCVIIILNLALRGPSFYCLALSLNSVVALKTCREYHHEHHLHHLCNDDRRYDHPEDDNCQVRRQSTTSTREPKPPLWEEPLWSLTLSSQIRWGMILMTIWWWWWWWWWWGGWSLWWYINDDDDNNSVICDQSRPHGWHHYGCWHCCPW